MPRTALAGLTLLAALTANNWAAEGGPTQRDPRKRPQAEGARERPRPPQDGQRPGQQDGQRPPRPMPPPEGEDGERPRRPFPPPPPMMAVLDSDHDGELSAEEIKNAAKALEQLDENGDGKLDHHELRPPLPPRGEDEREGPPRPRGPRPDGPRPEGGPGVPGGKGQKPAGKDEAPKDF